MDTKFFYTGTTAAIVALNEANGNSHQFVVRGDPTNETEYNDNVEWIGLESAPYTWSQVNTKKTELENAEPLRKLRVKRNRLLAETDYLALSDNTLSTDMANYRQELRDITNGLTTVAEVEAVTFPTKPE